MKEKQITLTLKVGGSETNYYFTPEEMRKKGSWSLGGELIKEMELLLEEDE